MSNKKLIQEKLEFHKRQSMTYEMLNRCANHLYDAFRELEMACQYCDNPEVRTRLESVRDMIGKDTELAGYNNRHIVTVISELQSILGDMKLN